MPCQPLDFLNISKKIVFLVPKISTQLYMFDNYNWELKMAMKTWRDNHAVSSITFVQEILTKCENDKE